MHYSQFDQNVHITCPTNDPSFKKEIMRVTGVKEELHYWISHGKTITNKTKYRIEDIGGVRNLIIRNFSEEDQKYCYFCTIGSVVSECKHITDLVRKYYYSY